MRTDRLLRLADLLEQDAENPKGVKFDLGSWLHSPNPEPTASCGTSACAIGLALVSGIFEAEGLYLELEGASSHYFCPVYQGRRNWPAVRTFFELDSHIAEYLFSIDSYVEPFEGAEAELRVAERIRYLCQKHDERQGRNMETAS